MHIIWHIEVNNGTSESTIPLAPIHVDLPEAACVNEFLKHFVSVIPYQYNSIPKWPS